MSTTELHKILLFEYDMPIDRNELLNYEAGIWYWKTKNTVLNVTDDHNVTGYYQYYQHIITYNIKSLKVSGVNYSRVDSLSDCRITDKSFYYDESTTELYIHFIDFETPDGKDIYFGTAVGYSKMPDNVDKPYFNDVYYEPRLLNVFGMKKSIDPLFFGILKYSSGSIKLINSDGHFDTWRSLNLYGQAARIMVGDVGNDYSTFNTVYEGFISDDSRTFDDFTVKLEDKRKGLTQPIASNKLIVSDYPYLSDGEVDKVKPVAFGTIKNAKAICLNKEEEDPDEEIYPDYYAFLIADTEFNNISSLDIVYIDGYVIDSSDYTVDLNNGTFTIASTYTLNIGKDEPLVITDSLDNITIDFIATSFSNGVDIIKDLMLNYDGKTFVSSFWDLSEVNIAEPLSRNTSLYINSGSTKLSKGIESICFDIDGRFFVKNDGKYTIRIYNENRTINSKVIFTDEMIGNPKIDNNGSEYLSSAIIEYSQDLDKNEVLTYENTDYQDEVFDTYKKLKVKTFKTNLTTLVDAKDKSETIMNISKNVQDEIKRSVSWENFGIEPSDFIKGSPETRFSQVAEYNIYEVLEVKSDTNKFVIDLTLRYIKDSALPVYATILDNNDNEILDNNNKFLIGRIN